ncbi:hypothetical protein ACFFRR_011805 [Megaselia abdita]
MTRNIVLIGFVAVALMAVGAQAQAQEGNFEKFMLDLMSPKILNEEYANVEKKLLYNTSTLDPETGANREETGYLLNPNTPGKEELLVMGAFGYTDDKGIETTTMYTSGTKGYRPRVSIKNRKLNPKLLASLAG